MEVNGRRKKLWKLKLKSNLVISWHEIALELEAVASIVKNHLVHFPFGVCSNRVGDVTLIICFIVCVLLPETGFFFAFNFDFEEISIENLVSSDVNLTGNHVARVIKWLIGLKEDVSSFEAHSAVDTVAHSVFNLKIFNFYN
jgi:hypothetical protein